MSAAFWTLIGLAIAVSIAFPVVLVAIARSMDRGRSKADAKKETR